MIVSRSITLTDEICGIVFQPCLGGPHSVSRGLEKRACKWALNVIFYPTAESKGLEKGDGKIDGNGFPSSDTATNSNISPD